MGVIEPTLWQIDGGLRPEGKDGPLVRRLESHEAYYEQPGGKTGNSGPAQSPPVADDTDLGQAYMDNGPDRSFGQLQARQRYDCQQMRKRVEDLIPNPAERQIKLGNGEACDVNSCRCSNSCTAAPTKHCVPAPHSNPCRPWPKARFTSPQNKPRNFHGTTDSNV